MTGFRPISCETGRPLGLDSITQPSDTGMLPVWSAIGARGGRFA
jgi:hypothetical protein